MVTEARMQGGTGHLRISVKDHNHAAVAQHFVVGQQTEQSGQEMLELAMAPFRGAFHLSKDQLPQKPGPLPDLKLLAEVVNTRRVTLQQSAHIRCARHLAEQLPVFDSDVDPLRTRTSIANIVGVVVKVVPQDAPVFSPDGRHFGRVCVIGEVALDQPLITTSVCASLGFVPIDAIQNALQSRPVLQHTLAARTMRQAKTPGQQIGIAEGADFLAIPVAAYGVKLMVFRRCFATP
ncbi:hypothetical protein WI90_08130 [Burkholderia ubonensis]|nr:hypothetical protein WI90_08130 [Burkholderia ubonensis]